MRQGMHLPLSSAASSLVDEHGAAPGGTLPEKAGETISRRKWLSPVPGEPRWPGMQMQFVDHVEPGGLERGASLSRMRASIRHDQRTSQGGVQLARLTYSRCAILGERHGANLVSAAACHHNSRAMKLDSKYFDWVRVQARRTSGAAAAGVRPASGRDARRGRAPSPGGGAARASTTFSAWIMCGSSTPPTITSTA